MKTKIMSVSKTGIFIACLLFLFSGNAMAQEKNKAPEGIKATIVATVDLHDASIVSQDAGKFKIGFNLANRDGIQPDVRYGITLIEQKGKDQFVIDQKVYDEVLNLGPKQILHKEIEYQAPKYLSGKYILLLEARNSDGLVFAMLPAGEVTLTGDGQYVNLSQEDCYLTIDGDKNGAKYNLRQGVDVAKEENIIINCEAQNNFSKDISATPYFQTYYRSQFGKMTDKASGTAIKFSQKQKSKVAISLVKAKDPQAYDAEMYLKDASGNQISNSVYLHYVLRGASATIQNIVLDKDSYKAGEVAKLSFNWSGSADSFPGSRGERTDIGTPKVTVSLMSKGSTCIDPYSQQLQDTDAKFNLNIKNNCYNPQLTLQIADKNGAILAEKTFGLKSSSGQSAEPAGTSLSDWVKKIILLLTVVLVLVVIVQGIRKRSGAKFTIFFLIIFSGLTAAKGASATIFSLHIPGTFNGETVYYSGTLDHAVYLTDEKMTANGNAYISACNNTGVIVDLLAFVNHTNVGGEDYYLGGKYMLGGKMLLGQNTYFGYAENPAPMTPGHYADSGFDGWIRATWSDWNHDGLEADNELLPAPAFYHYFLGYPYDVVAAPKAGISASPLNVASGGSSTITWSSQNTTACYGYSKVFATGAPTSLWNTAGYPGTPISLGGSSATPALTSTTAYWLQCEAKYGERAFYSNVAEVDIGILPPAPAVCGPASKAYTGANPGYVGNFCVPGNGTASPAVPSFPAKNGSTSWQCLSTTGGANITCPASWFPTCTPNNSYSCTFSGGACSADDCGKSVSKVALCEKTETKANCDTVKTFVTPTTLCGSSCVSETKDCPQCETTWKEKEP